MESEIIEQKVSENHSVYSVTFTDAGGFEKSRIVLYCEDKKGAEALQNALACHAKDISIFS